jgi:hypothetical protein
VGKGLFCKDHSSKGRNPIGVACAELAQKERPWCSYNNLFSSTHRMWEAVKQQNPGPQSVCNLCFRGVFESQLNQAQKYE